MKRIYLFVIAAFALSASSMAQRNIDWSVEEIIKPTEIESNTTNGSLFDIEFVGKNNGSDIVMAGDSVFTNVVFLNASNQVIFAYPGTTSFSVFVTTKSVAVGDTMHVHIRLLYPSYTIGTQNTKLRIASLIINRGSDKVADEPTASAANNILIKDMMWWNPQKWSVGVDEVNSEVLMNVFPNPAQNEFNISYKIASIDNPNQVHIYDIQGKLVKSFTSELGATSDRIDVSALPAGIYVVKVNSGDLESQQKLQILK